MHRPDLNPRPGLPKKNHFLSSGFPFVANFSQTLERVKFWNVLGSESQLWHPSMQPERQAATGPPTAAATTGVTQVRVCVVHIQQN